MLLNELTGIKDKAKMTATDILRTLKSDGIKMASGSYGMVLMKSDWDHVLKFFPYDPCYMMFVDYCLKNKSNKHLPKFKKQPIPMHAFFQTTPGKKKINKFYAVKVEKLQPLVDQEDIHVVGIAGSKLLAIKYNYAKEEHKEKEFLDDYLKPKASDKFGDLSKQRDFFELVFDLRDNVEGNVEGTKCFLDFHEGNVMKRGSDLVIIDPFADLHQDDAIDLEKIFYTSVLDELTKGEEVKTQNITKSIENY
jgi:hypothetical protein